ncbi:MAG: dihydropteroate synthase [Deltaproteobacteria bacterium]|nr:dihydropteroate synthase [Deltaproteobacteria bacterium]
MRYLHITSSAQAENELKKVGVDLPGIDAMLPKMENINLLLEGIECKIANILKQEMLSIGGDVAVARGSVSCSIDSTDAIIIGTPKQVRRLADKIAPQPFTLRDISEDIRKVLDNITRDTFVLRTPKREIIVGERTLVMGILNMTPDSFSDGGMFGSVEDALKYALEMEESGADIIDIGGESSRPGSEPVSAKEELDRVIPLIKKLEGLLSIPISIDTTKADVARRAIESGAEMVNDISAMRFDTKMPEVIAGCHVPVVLMHMRGVPETMQEGDLAYRALMGEITGFLKESIENAQSSGVDVENIIVDPGIGFGKSTADNIAILRHLRELKTLGRPIMVGTSRKRFIGEITGEKLAGDRVAGTAASVAASIMNGADIVRVHDVEFMKKLSGVVAEIKR